MGFPFILGIVVAALGIAALVLAWIHPASTSLAIARVLAWPRKNQDRIDLALRGVFLVALGGIFMSNAPNGNIAALLTFAVLLLSSGIALGVRQPAV